MCIRDRVKGLPLYETQRLFDAAGEFTDMSVSYITLLPGKRVPESGTGFHAEDAYSFFLEGEKLPEEFEALPLLCALWETGRVRPERVSVQAHFHS